MYSGTRHGQIYSALTKALLKARFIEAEKWKKKKKSLKKTVNVKNLPSV